MKSSNTIKIDSSKKDKFIKTWGVLIFLYVASISLQRLLFLPFVGVKFQLPEIIFIIKLWYLGLNYKRLNFRFLKLNKFDIALFLFVAIIVLLSFINPPHRPNITVIGILYLWLNYVLFSFYFKQQSNQINKLIIKSIKWMGIIACFPVVVGLTQLIMKGNSQFFQIYNNYPMIGDVKRAIGLT